MRPTPQLPTLEVYMLGLVDFLEVQQLQRRIVYDLGEQGGAALILCEHPPTISVGRAGSRAHIGPDDDTLRSLGIKVHWVNRGGGCVFHLPGQLSRLFRPAAGNSRSDAVGEYLDRLHMAIVLVLEEFDLTGTFRPGVPGVFSGQRGSPRSASPSPAGSPTMVSRSTSALISSSSTCWTSRDNGQAPLRYTSMEARRQRHTAMSKVREALVRRLEEVFGLERHHVYTKHPMIRGKVFSHVYAPTPG